MYQFIKIKGDSMLPCYREDDYVLLIKNGFRSIRVGDDVVCNHHQYGIILKRIYKCIDDKLYLTGLNSKSTDRADLGAVENKDIIGCVIWHIKHAKGS